MDRIVFKMTLASAEARKQALVVPTFEADWVVEIEPAKTGKEQPASSLCDSCQRGLCIGLLSCA